MTTSFFHASSFFHAKQRTMVFSGNAVVTQKGGGNRSHLHAPHPRIISLGLVGPSLDHQKAQWKLVHTLCQEKRVAQYDRTPSGNLVPIREINIQEIL